MISTNYATLSEETMIIAAKSDAENCDNWLPLWIHLCDTAYVMDFLLNNWVSSIYDVDSMEKEQIKKVGIFAAAVHDVGKATPAFQSMISPKIKGHSKEIIDIDVDISKQFTEKERIEFGHHAEGGALLLEKYGLCREVAVVIASHHGVIPRRGYADEEASNLAQHETLFWDKNSKNKWQAIQNEHINFALELSGLKSLRDVPSINKEMQIILSGLLITADWIASNTTYFPLVSRSIGNDMLKSFNVDRGAEGLKRLKFPAQWKAGNTCKNKDLINEYFGFTSNSIQEKVQQIARNIDNPGLFIIEAPMGSGKTEAGLAVAEILAKKMNKTGLAFFLPSQATTNALFTRVEKWARNQTDEDNLAIQLAHGSFLLNNDFDVLKNSNYEQSGNPELIAHQFFCGNKSFLMANFVVGTIDQLLMAAVQQKHVMLKHLGLADKIVIIDECHAYDAYMNTYLDRILKYLCQYKVPVILLSATLPSKRRAELFKAYNPQFINPDIDNTKKDLRYPLISWTDGNHSEYEPVVLPSNTEKTISIEYLSEEHIVDTIKYMSEAGACVGVILNTVAKAQEIAKQVEGFAFEKMTLYHAQYLVPDRFKKESTILKLAGKTSSRGDRNGVVVIGTQVLEQSLDIDFDVLITELCPMDLLLQRIGRLHRHNNRIRPEKCKNARCLIVGTGKGEFDIGTKAIYGEYLLKKTSSLLTDKIVLPRDISGLVQSTYDENNVEDLLKEEYIQFCLQREGQKQRASSFLLLPITHSRRNSNTIEGLSVNNVTEDTARASVRDGDPSVEVIVLCRNSDSTYSLLSKDETDCVISFESTPEYELAKKIASQRLRLPYKLSNKWNGPKVIDCLRKESDEMMGMAQKSPWLHNELFMILDSSASRQLLDHYRIHYSHKYGLVIEEE